MQLESMYQEIILDHYRHPHHRGLREPFDAEVHHVNPVCGDEVTLRVVLKDVGGQPVVGRTTPRVAGSSPARSGWCRRSRPARRRPRRFTRKLRSTS